MQRRKSEQRLWRARLTVLLAQDGLGGVSVLSVTDYAENVLTDETVQRQEYKLGRIQY